MMAIAAVVVLYIFDISPLPSLFEGGNPRPFAKSAPRTGAIPSIDGYDILSKGYLLESGSSVYLAKKAAPLMGGDIVYLLKCQGEACSRLKIVQVDKVTDGVASSRFDQFVILSRNGARLDYVNLADNVASHGNLRLQCQQPAGAPPPALRLRSVGGRTLYLQFTGQDCLTARVNRAEFNLTGIELNRPTTDELRLQFAASGALSSLVLERGLDSEGRRLK